MAEDIAREIIAQSKGGGKLALKISHKQQQESSLIFSFSKDANQKLTYHIYFTKDATPIEIKYSNLGGACDFVGYMFPLKTNTDNFLLKLVLHNKNISESECIELSTICQYFRISTLSSSFEEIFNVLDVTDAVAG